MFSATFLREALQSLGLLLTDRGLAFEIAIVGGGGLLLLGEIARPTEDLDAIAVISGGRFDTADPLPEALGDAVEDVARLLGLPKRWLNGGPTSQLRFGLPEGFAARTSVEVFGGLTVRLASRFDQICLKLYAAADGGRNSKHVRDLIEMTATRDELFSASPWVRRQDLSPEFHSFVQEVIDYVGATHG